MDSLKLEYTWFNNLPLFDEDKSLMLMFDQIESEAVPAKIAYIQSNASYNNKLDFHIFESIFSVKQSVVSISSTRNIFNIIDFNIFKQFQRKIHKDQSILPLFVFTNRL